MPAANSCSALTARKSRSAHQRLNTIVDATLPSTPTNAIATSAASALPLPGAHAHDPHHAAESEQHPGDLVARERLAQHERRDERERQRVGRRDDRADARREMAQRDVRAAQVHRVAEDPVDDDGDPVLARARQPRAQRARDREREQPGHGEAHDEKPQRRRAQDADLARHERRRPQEDVEERSGDAESPAMHPLTLPGRNRRHMHFCLSAR